MKRIGWRLRKKYRLRKIAAEKMQEKMNRVPVKK